LARWLPGALVRLLGYTGIGIGWCVTHLVIYCAAYPEYAPLIHLARDEDRPRRVYALTQLWRRAALRRCAFFAAVGMPGWLALRLAVDLYGARFRLLVVVLAVAGCATVGRVARPPHRPEDDPPGEPDVPENAPYPIADAHTRAEAADCVARALTAENIALRLSGEAVRTRWGWSVPVILRTGTPAAIVARTGELETHLDLPAGGVLATPDRARRARVVLRLAQTDPFIGLGYAPQRPPASLSITQRVVIGQQIDGTDLAIPLLGVHGVLIGSPGSGKSTTLLALGEAVTACADAVLWDLDPAGDGLRLLGPAVGRRERDPMAIEEALADALALAESRPRMLADLGMGAAWVPSPQRPAVVVTMDEYPRLTAQAKQLAVQLLRVGRKARVTLILAATEATSDALGAAIADTTALKILHACRFQDIQLVLGPQMGAEGWRPDRLHPATADDPGDAGRCYVATAGHREPLLSKVAPVDVDRLAEQGAQRAAFGLPRIDADSWESARARRTGPSATNHEDAGRPILDHQGITDLLAAFDGDSRVWTEDLLSRLAGQSTRYVGWTGEDLAALVRPLGVAPKGIKRDGVNRNGYDHDAISAAYQARQGGGGQW
jgi:S-DNA-T family DNA segregation ATPase FtsK/SpoIIIE